MSQNTQIIILAGGKGKRMNQEIPKALVLFHGKPMIDYAVDAVKKSGVCDVPVLVVGYQKELIIEHVGSNAKYAVQEEQLGTGHAVLITENSIDEDVENVLVLYGDAPAVTGAMIANLNQTHIESGAMLTMATVTVPTFDDWYQVFFKPFSRVIRGSDGKIVRSVEFKDATEEEKEIKELNPCYFCFNKKWLFENLKNVGNSNTQGEYYLTDLVQLAANTGDIASVAISPEGSLGVNSIEELERLEKIVKK